MWSPDPSIIITAEQKADEATAAAWAALRADRDQRLAATDWLVRRHEEEQTLSIATTLSAQVYADLLGYRQALRELPENTTDPTSLVWPFNPLGE